MSLFDKLAEAERVGKPLVICTVIRESGSTPRKAGSKMLVYPDGRIEGTIGGGEMEKLVIREALLALSDSRSRIVEYKFNDPEDDDQEAYSGLMEVFVDPIKPFPTVVVVGIGHIGQAVVHLAHWLGYRVIVFDDREGFCTPENVPEADDHITGSAAELAAEIDITSETYFVFATRSVDVDVDILPQFF